ncbi:glycosyltransferase 87 family protein [Sphingomonas sp. HITSZ_GF]|uniref:glycosyltransferase 87 family protein n=1 Tax=Sphingomonas sp. HITSZ_GF TaxID=3037247 RepID=UPI00240E7E6F|nr:glycosyltransferase 87 family protein [Sphingomonas sp. HITSZ_GF]MDG2533507.1 glycosyltransferase 87 family protein [Sphingomonas sp. HITSZ_GF]
MRLKLDRHLRALLIVLAVTCALGFGFKQHCMPGGWTHSEQYITGCYSDAVPFWSARQIDKGKIPYLQTPIEYPVLTGAAIWIEGAATHLIFRRHANDGDFLGVVTAVNIALAFLVLWMLWRAGLDRQRLWWWAAAPPLILYVGHNWDMIAVTLAVAALLQARENRLVRAGALAGLGVAAKLFPIVILPLLGLSALFERERSWPQRLRRAALVTLAAIRAWTAVNLPVALAAPDNWAEFYLFSQSRSGTAAGSWDVLGVLGWLPLGTPEKNLYATLAFAIGGAAIVALGWRRHRDRLWLLATPLLGWFLLTNKVYSPQFDLWIWPLLVMTAPRLWPVALFAITGIFAYFAEFWFFAGMDGAWPAASTIDIAFAAMARALVLLWIIADCLRKSPPEWVGRWPVRD